tara:strand:- start:55 stop:675 length:621 start_codon:yes stop_codon:yes gene_type:complete
MNYQQYLEKYIKEKNFLKVMGYKNTFLYDTQTKLFTGLSLLFLFLFGLIMALSQNSMGLNLIASIMFLISFLFFYFILTTRLKKVLMAYQKENNVYWEYVLMPKELEENIPSNFTYQIGKKDKFIKVVIYNLSKNFELFNPFDIEPTPINVQELSASREQSSVERLTSHKAKTTTQEIIEKGTLLLLLGGEGFLIFILITEILNKV